MQPACEPRPCVSEGSRSHFKKEDCRVSCRTHRCAIKGLKTSSNASNRSRSGLSYMNSSPPRLQLSVSPTKMSGALIFAISLHSLRHPWISRFPRRLFIFRAGRERSPLASRHPRFLFCPDYCDDLILKACLPVSNSISPSPGPIVLLDRSAAGRRYSNRSDFHHRC